MAIKEYYKDSREYLLDLMKFLDLKLYKFILREDLQNKNVNPFKGLVITEEDVLKTLDGEEIKSQKIEDIENQIQNIILKINDKLLESEHKNIDLRLGRLCNTFDLTEVEKNLIIIGMCIEVNPKYEKIFAYIQDNINKKRPSLNLGLKLLDISDYEKLDFMNKTKSNSFFRLFILSNNSFESYDAFLSNDLVIHNRIIDYILDNDNLDSDIENCAQLIEFKSDVLYTKQARKNIDEIYSYINNYFEYEGHDEENLFIFLHGDKGVGKKHIANIYSVDNKKDLIILDILILIKSGIYIKDFMRNVIRETVLRQGVMVFDNYQSLSQVENFEIALKDLFSYFKYYQEPIFIVSEEKFITNDYFSKNTVYVKQIDRPNFEMRKELWELYAREYEVDFLDIDDLSTKFNFAPLQIKNTVKSIKSKELNEDNLLKEIYASCYEQVDTKLTDKAVKVKVTYDWEQLILPVDEKKLLRDACNQVKNRFKVYESWGFGKKVAYGKGLSIICAGPPGTGKTMSAQVMANELKLELYRIDLSQMVSKYIGETEKNLHMIFSQASLSNAILFFDEGDALFGKRSEVKSSNDRYSNIETSYLLQKMEEYEGITILTTNFIKNIDKAFLRRINYIVNFPFPDFESRKLIWEITVPNDAPISVDVDFDFLAKTFEIAGGNIKNVLVYAAFLAAQEKKDISMKHILFSAKYELQKMDKLLLKDDFGEYRYILDEF